jgi:hypothetical protein
MSILILSICLLYAYAGVLIHRQERIWINPITFVLIYYFFNYPVRAALILYFPDTFNTYAFQEEHVFDGLTYSTLYVVIFVWAYFSLLRAFRTSFRDVSLPAYEPDVRMSWVASIVVSCAGAVVLGFEVLEGRAFSLGQDIEDLRRPLWVNIAGLFYAAKWFALCLGILVWMRTQNLGTAIGSLALLTLIVSEGVLSTGKGFIVSLIMLFLFIDNLLTGRNIRASAVAIGGVTLVLFSSYSYYARYYVGLGGETSEIVGELSRYFAYADVYNNVAAQLESILNRGTYYLDGLSLMMRDGVAVAPGPYALGSTVELLNIIPRATGLISEQYSFDRHVTESIWREWSFSQVFIGRIGESYFVLGYAGLMYAAVNAIVFALVARAWTRASRSLAGIALYFAALTSWLHQDASLFYQSKALIYILVAYYVIKLAVGYSAFPVRDRPLVSRHS